MTYRLCIDLTLPVGDLGHAPVVVAAALTLLHADDAVRFVSAGEPDEETAQTVASLCAQTTQGEIRPHVLLCSAEEARGADAERRMTIPLCPDALRAAAGAAKVFAAVTGSETRETKSPENGGEGVDLRRNRDLLIRRRRAARRGAIDRPCVAFVAQVQSTWGAAEPLFEGLRADPAVDVVVVAVPSEHETHTEDIGCFFRRKGAQVVDGAWLRTQLDDANSALAAVVFYDPWDGLRSAPCRAVDVAEAGVPIVYLPYANSMGVGVEGVALATDLPVQRLAKAIFVASDAQKRLFAENCLVGAHDVHVTGSPKIDRVVRLREAEPRRNCRTFLWNPHFHVEEDGFSMTVERHEDMLKFFRDRRDLHLIIRPHFRLVRDYPLMGGAYARCWERIRDADRIPNIDVDLGPDYLPAFEASDALISDPSSLVMEYIHLDRPALVTAVAPVWGVSEATAFINELPLATTWAETVEFIEGCTTDASTYISRVREIRSRAFPLQDGRSLDRVLRCMDGLLR